MKRNKRTHSPEFKAAIALEAIKGKYAVREIAEMHGLNPTLVHAWRQQFTQAAVALFQNAGNTTRHTPASRGLDRRLQELKTEQDWMRRAVAALDLQEKRALVENGSLSLLAQARLLGLHRSGLYYQKRHHTDAHRTLPVAGADSGKDAVRQTA